MSAQPAPTSYLLYPSRQNEIVSAAFLAEQRLSDRERAAEDAAVALQVIEADLDWHIVRCLTCVRQACAGLTSLRRQRDGADQRYQQALAQLRGER